jgi:hypothetical protein|tara:strand:+ start:959 stop:1177 length:219 start_codon:yes stop_codon:yes gene_type:complete
MTSPYEYGMKKEEEQIIDRFRKLSYHQTLAIVNDVLELLDEGSFSKDQLDRVERVDKLFWKIKNGNSTVRVD